MDGGLTTEACAGRLRFTAQILRSLYRQSDGNSLTDQAPSERQFRCLRVVDVSGDRTVLDPADSLIDRKQGRKEPFLGHYRLAETILDFDIKAGGAKKPYGSGFRASPD